MFDERSRATLAVVSVLVALAYLYWWINPWLAGQWPAFARNRLSAEVWVVLDRILP